MHASTLLQCTGFVIPRPFALGDLINGIAGLICSDMNCCDKGMLVYSVHSVCAGAVTHTNSRKLDEYRSFQMFREWTLLDAYRLEARMMMATSVTKKLMEHTAVIYKKIYP